MRSQLPFGFSISHWSNLQVFLNLNRRRPNILTSNVLRSHGCSGGLVRRFDEAYQKPQLAHLIHDDEAVRARLWRELFYNSATCR